MTCSRKIYVQVAAIISDGRRPDSRTSNDPYDAGYESAYGEMQRALADVFENENPAFDRARFNAACEPR
jgi:hypothetical protein